ncbi:WRKY DNA-binding transcription factor 70-like [Andrographis paniculata]|uniref:WRKY DNA-binding transcription factor 70-like n=1 Tax=Andrographis paniculata TaxID=175694 RepID=UPI0021E96173|nr:WRKY DNA-binding transcription factor 70-like [Andrographis paniculata]
MGGGNRHGRKTRMAAELLKGKELAIQLLNHLKNSARDDDLVVSAEELAHQILTSFGNSLSQLSSRAVSVESSSAQIPAVDSGVRKKTPAPLGLRNRRGCYKRRRTSDSWTVESSTAEDEFAWRKYGQKLILNSHYPRCYYRCTYKNGGCKATKQVQMIKEKPNTLYQITYINHHSCSSSSSSSNPIRAFYKNPNFSLDDDDDVLVHPNKINNLIITFEAKNGGDSRIITSGNHHPAVKSEEQTDARSLAGLQSCGSTNNFPYSEDISDPFGNEEIDSFFCFGDDEIDDHFMY